jgi:hypothetical protein
VIADFQLPIFDWRLAIEPIGNRQLQIENPETHPLPRGGTDFMAHTFNRKTFKLLNSRRAFEMGII